MSAAAPSDPDVPSDPEVRRAEIRRVRLDAAMFVGGAAVTILVTMSGLKEDAIPGLFGVVLFSFCAAVIGALRLSAGSWTRRESNKSMRTHLRIAGTILLLGQIAGAVFVWEALQHFGPNPNRDPSWGEFLAYTWGILTLIGLPYLFVCAVGTLIRRKG